jgi:hypothetical protein
MIVANAVASRQAFEHRKIEINSCLAFAAHHLQIDFFAPELIAQVGNRKLYFVEHGFRSVSSATTTNWWPQTLLVAAIRGAPNAHSSVDAKLGAIDQDCRGSKARSKRDANESIRSPNRSSRSWISARLGSAPIVSRKR